MKLSAVLFSVLLGVFSSTGQAVQEFKCSDFSKSVANGKAAEKFKRFLDIQWKYYMTVSPEWATYVGYPGQNDRWTDVSLPSLAKRKELTRCQLKALTSIGMKGLTKSDQLTYKLLVRSFEEEIAGYRFDGDYLPLNQLDGPQTDVVDVLMAMPTTNVKSYQDMLARLEKIPDVFLQTEALMREGMKRKVTVPKMFMPKVVEQVNSLLEKDADKNPLLKPFTELSQNKAIAADDQQKLKSRANEILLGKVIPSLEKFKTFLVNDYTPACRESVSWADLPNGKAWYQHRVKRYTTTNATPDQLHEVGLKEVDRITGEMMKIKDRVKFKGDLKAFNKFLMTDKQFYFSTPEELLASFRDIAKRVDPELTRLFKTLPRLTYGVREIPAFRAASSPGGEYQGGSLEAGRPGWFQANTYDLKSRSKWAMETLVLHEAVPGHHLQIALARELQNTPEIRKYGGYTAFSEGWALYSESLGEELGMFKDPYQLYGHYSDEMMRAVRLVVDTGLHAKGWSKQKAWDYYRSKMPVTDIESEIEINRYIVWPGQALAYKVGQLKIRELRDRAQAKLGEKFDVRSFHDVVLLQGALPMDVLEGEVDSWIDSESRKAKMR